jgi:indole-3-glycerol phosphate synthase/phosphoribosylanthranilate isomerase
MTTVLERIVARTREDVESRKRRLPLDRAQLKPPAPSEHRAFAEALGRAGYINVIAEFKRRSPSRGAISERAEPVHFAQAYEVGGAAALSVLTDEPFFGGSMDDLAIARAATLLPALRKDFIVDPYQVTESVVGGADAILLIAAALPGKELRKLHAAALQAQLEVLVEVHDRAELDRALEAGARILGVNNRDLRTMTVDPGTALSLAPYIPDAVVAVAESGMRGADDILRFRDAGYDAFLIGEHLMTQASPVSALEQLVEEATRSRFACSRAPESRVAVKICGITSVDDGLMAARAGADAVGLVLWPGSRRAVDPDTARAIADAMPPLVQRVGVFVDPSLDEVALAVEEIGLDAVQLHGDETPEFCRAVGARVLKALRVGAGFDASSLDAWSGAAAGILLDTRVDGPDAPPGGTGRAFDWALARPARDHAAFLVLAGGLTAQNVAEAVAVVRPDAVDVSSGVEFAQGRKDPALVRAFVRAARGGR